MRKNHYINLVCLMCLLVLILPAFAQGLIVGGLSAFEVCSQAVSCQNAAFPSHSQLNDLANQASHVLIGEVKSIESRLSDNGTLIYSYIKVFVEEYLKGSSQGEEAVIRCLGGEAGDLGLAVSSEPTFLKGERVKVFLKLLETGEFIIVGGKQGKISLSQSPEEYSYPGIRWDSNDLPVKYYINELRTPDQIVAVQQCFQTWEDDPGSYMDYTYMGTTNRTAIVRDGYNVVSWGNIDGPGKTLARTRYWYRTATRLLIEFDILFDGNETWSTTGEPDKYDVQNVGTHEVGHTLVLNDLVDPADSEETMYYISYPGETKKRTLHTGDIEGIRFIYTGSIVAYTIATVPIGLRIEVDGTSYTAPKSFEWYPDSRHTLNAPSPQSVDTVVRYSWSSWTEGGQQSHSVTVGRSNTTITANYVEQYYSTINTSGLIRRYPATVRFMQVSALKTASTYGNWSDWCDVGSTLNIDNIVSVSETERYSTITDCLWTVTSKFSVNVHYYRQWKVTITTNGLKVSYPTTIACTQHDTVINQTTSDMWTDWVDNNSTVSIQNPVSGESGERWNTYNMTSWTIKSAISSTIEYVHQCQVSITFGTNDGLVALYPAQIEILGASPNNTLSKLTTYLNIWLDDISWTVKQILWQGNNIVPDPNPQYLPTANGIWTVNSRVYPISFSNAFKDSRGTALYTLPSAFTLTFPNGTNSAPLDPSLSYYIQNGTAIWSSIIWQGTQVFPAEVSFNATNGNPSVNCRIYSIRGFIWRNYDGTKELYGAPTSVTIRWVNGTSKTYSPVPSLFPQVQVGTHQITSIIWQGVDVCPSPFPSIALTSNQIPTTKCMVYDVSIRVIDLFGLPVSEANISVTLPTGTIVTAQTDGTGVAILPLIPKGPFTATIFYVAQTFTISGDAARAALTPAKARIITLFDVLSVVIPIIILALYLIRRRLSRPPTVPISSISVPKSVLKHWPSRS